ncbi:hypothetical protein GCM10020255_008320 [Rhodococcus baikonurensis]
MHAATAEPDLGDDEGIAWSTEHVLLRDTDVLESQVGVRIVAFP